MDVGQIVTWTIAVGGWGWSAITYRLGVRNERRNAESHHEGRRPRFEVSSLWLNGPSGAPHVQLEHTGGPDIDEVVLSVLPSLPGTLGAGQLMELGRGTSVTELTLEGPMRPGDVCAARVALDRDRRGPELRLRLTYRVLGKPRRWPRRDRPIEQWSDTASVSFPLPARVSSAVGIRLPSEAELARRRRR